MTSPAPINGHALLDFNSPLSDARAAALIRSLPPLPDPLIADYGCGWGELLLRAVEATPGARGVGVDSDERAIERGRAAVAERVPGRVELELGDATAWEGPAVDVAVCVGAAHAWGGIRATLEALHGRVRPGGAVVVGDAFWEHPPNDVALEVFGEEGYGTLAELVDLAVEVGYRPLRVSVASRDEWDDFESRWCASRELWLLANPGHPEADGVRALVDEHRDGWLRGYRDSLGFAYLVLARP
ncbi:hypothetical protein APASM_5323 [Actinosynnema pretiosum subsp. pretiosum]|nr:hypothetical protein APASM_5323 [Actinosynnema pretiosum subsp. pretiosum]